MPKKVNDKIKIINYPCLTKEDIEIICEDIWQNLSKGREQKNLTLYQARLCGDFMMLLNRNGVLTPWSLRDISKLFVRINKQSINPEII